MMSARARFEQNLELARSLGPIVSRGVKQHFFVSPALPLEPLSLHEITAAWRQLVSKIKSGKTPDLLSLYIHIPFCSHKCHYCIFHSIGGFDPRDLDAYLDRLHREIDHYTPIFEGVRFATCYIGGGTPTVLSVAQLEHLLQHLERSFARRRGGEWAFECNPLTVTEDKARLFEKHGFNRVSFGVQSLNPTVLDSVNRGYQSMELVAETFRIMKACRFWINLDLIHGLPGDTFESLEYSLRRILEFNPNQVTIYALSPYTPMPLKPTGQNLDELAERLKLIARNMGFVIGIHSTSLDLMREKPMKSSDDRLSEEQEKSSEHFPYDDTTVEPFSLLGIGPTARCYIYGSLSYSFNAYPVNDPFDPSATIVRARPVTMAEERRRFVVNGLSLENGLDPTTYSTRFGHELEEAFGRELDELLGLGVLNKSDGWYIHKSRDPLVRFAAELFFLEERMLEAARRAKEDSRSVKNNDRSETNGTEDRCGFLLEAPSARVRIVLANYWPGRPCFHHSKQFAFYIPSDLPEGTCQHGALEERLLAAFKRLFDRVIAKDSPDSIEALHQALFARGRRLRLTTRTPNGTETVPIHLSTQE